VVISEKEWKGVCDEVFTDHYQDEEADNDCAEVCAQAVLEVLGLRREEVPDGVAGQD
jgi:hypothetical protein